MAYYGKNIIESGSWISEGSTVDNCCYPVFVTTLCHSLVIACQFKSSFVVNISVGSGFVSWW